MPFNSHTPVRTFTATVKASWARARAALWIWLWEQDCVVLDLPCVCRHFSQTVPCVQNNLLQICGCWKALSLLQQFLTIAMQTLLLISDYTQLLLQKANWLKAYGTDSISSWLLLIFLHARCPPGRVCCPSPLTILPRTVPVSSRWDTPETPAAPSARCHLNNSIKSSEHWQPKGSLNLNRRKLKEEPCQLTKPPQTCSAFASSDFGQTHTAKVEL